MRGAGQRDQDGAGGDFAHQPDQVQRSYPARNGQSPSLLVSLASLFGSAFGVSLADG